MHVLADFKGSLLHGLHHQFDLVITAILHDLLGQVIAKWISHQIIKALESHLQHNVKNLLILAIHLLLQEATAALILSQLV